MAVESEGYVTSDRSDIPLESPETSGMFAWTASMVKESKFVHDAGALLLLNLLSKGALFFGTAYMAKCLGPTNLGISGVVLVTAQQVALGYNGGFDMVAVRKIAVNKSRCHGIARPIVSFRIWAAFAIGAVWAAICFLTKSNSQLYVWLLGLPILLLLASNVVFSFQGLERLPLQNAIGAFGSILMSASYFFFFRPHMSLGSDLFVYILAGVATLILSHYTYRRINGAWPVGSIDRKDLVALLRESWRYWLWTIFVFYYSLFQIPLISYMLGPRETGLYRIAFTMAAGVELLFNSVTSLLLPRLSVWHSGSPLAMRKKQFRLLKVFLLIGVPPVAVLLLISRRLFQILAGPEFDQSVLPFQILLVGRLIVFLGQIYAYGMAAAGQDTAFLIITAGGCVFSVVTSLLILKTFGLVGAATVSLATESIIFLLAFLYGKRHLRIALAQ